MAKNFKESQILEAVKKSGGVMSYVAASLECNWETAKNHVAKHPKCAEAFDVAGSKLNVKAYQSFHKAIEDGQKWAVERVLDTSARKDGHGLVNRVDVTSAGERIEKIEVEYVKPKKDANGDDEAEV